jgi:hypothetical protein
MIRMAESKMLQALQLESAQIFQIRQLDQEREALIGLSDPNRSAPQQTFSLPTLPLQEPRTIPTVPTRRIRWNTQAPNAGYHTYVERISKRRRTQ